ncbi:MAG: flagellar hook-associated protein FlgK [Syntrophobacteraceae bacterium]
MAGLTLTLETAKQTLLNTQVQIQTASHNIANAESTTYSRQKAVIATNYATRVEGGWVGTGAHITQITQMRDQFLEMRLRDSISDESKYESLASQLESIQAAFADDGDTGVSQALGEFWDAWDLLAQDPDGITVQSEVYQSAQNLADTIKTAYDRLNTIATEEIPARIDDTVEKANALIDKIAEINLAITKSETSQYPANDLRDSRYEALQELSELIPIDYSEDANGVVTVQTTDASGQVTIVSGGTPTHITSASTIEGGQLGGLREALTDLAGSSDGTVDGYMDRLDRFTASLISEVNTIHGDNGGPVVFTGTSASTITASTTFLDGQTAADESARALAMASFQGTSVTFSDGKTATLSGYLSDIQKQMGSDTSLANDTAEYDAALRSQLETRQQAVSGVSIDEEMVDLLQFQQVYQAAAKIVSKTAELLNVVINMA